MKHLLLWGLVGFGLGYFMSSTLQGFPVIGSLYTSVAQTISGSSPGSN